MMDHYCTKEEQIREHGETIAVLKDNLDKLKNMQEELAAVVTGNGDPRKGMAFQVQMISDWVAEERKQREETRRERRNFGWGLLLKVLGILGAGGILMKILERVL